jgi:membrane-associated phospholipid phosphatase
MTTPTRGKRLMMLALVLTFAARPALAQTAAPEPAEKPPSFGSIFRDLGPDFLHVVSWQSGAILGTAGAASLLVHDSDASITRRASESQLVDTIFDQGAGIGNGATQIGAALAVYGVGRAVHDVAAASVGADLIAAQIVNAALTTSIKVAVDRERPDGGSYSFPSGHASASFATAAVLERHLGWRAGIPAYAVASYVAVSRLPENKHFTSDVIFGAAVGLVSGRATTVGRGRATFAVSPMTVHKGGGVWLTLVGSHAHNGGAHG